MNESNELKCYDFYFQSAKMDDCTPRNELKKIVSGWTITPEQMQAITTGMCFALLAVAGYKHGTIRVYCGNTLENVMSI